MKVVLSDEAARDLLNVSDHIARDSPLRARELVRQIRKRVMQLRDTPLAYPLLPRFEKRGIRRRVFRDYLIFYQLEGETIRIVRVLHGARDYEALLSTGH